jgi:hypothetical protein
MNKNKTEIVTFKADESLIDALRAVPNRSEFIRSCVMQALQSVCPLCRGTGILSPGQKRHWENLAADHEIKECGDCHELHIVCSRGSHTG